MLSGFSSVVAGGIRFILASLLSVSTVVLAVPSIGWMQPNAPDASETRDILAEPQHAVPLSGLAESPTTTPAEGSASSDYFLSVAPPDLPLSDIPARMSYDEARAFVEGLLTPRFTRLLDALDRLRQEGLVADAEVRLEQIAVVARGVKVSAVELLASLPEVAQAIPLADSTSAHCGAVTLQALTDQVYSFSQVASLDRFDGVEATSLGSTPPKIHIRTPLDSGWSYFYGQAAPNKVVNMRILRAGAVIATGSTTSDSTGHYVFYPSWRSGSDGCGGGGYAWSLRPGDVVEVTADSQTASTVVAQLHVWADPTANTVSGHTDPNRRVEVTLYHAGGTFTQTVNSGSSGAFSASFGDFDRRAGVRVDAFDANGHSTFQWVYAYHIRVRQSTWGSSVEGSLKPRVSYTVVVTRGSSAVFTSTGQTEADNSFYSYLPSSLSLQPNDIIFVSGGGASLQYVFAELSNLAASVGTGTGTISGKTSAGREVQVCRGYVYYYSSFNATCNFHGTCSATTAGSSGSFAATVPGLLRGDRLQLTIFDVEGNRQVHELAVSAIRAYPENRQVRGFWIRPRATLTITVRRPDNSTESFSRQMSDYAFSVFGVSVPVGTVITVTDGTLTETMRVRSLTVRINEANGQLTGNADSGRLIAMATDRWMGTQCVEEDVNGAYALSFSNMPLRGQSIVYGAWLRGADGHYTAREYLYAFTINAFMNTRRVTGYTERLGADITVTLQRSGSPLATITATSSSDTGFYSVSLGSAAAVITTGDKVIVQSSDGDSATLDVPEFTVNRDGAGNSVHGRAPAGSRVDVSLQRWYGTSNWDYYVYSRRVIASSANTYSASFAGQLGSWRGICAPISVNHRCSRIIASQYSSAGHATVIEEPIPLPVSPDAYENDDTQTTAKPYTSTVQIRSFHTVTDVDWVTFTVPTTDVVNAVPYIIAAFNEGWGGAACIELHTFSGSHTRCEVGVGSVIRHVFTAAGTYRVRVYPNSSWYAAHCDASYRLMILPARHRVFLPAASR